MYRTAVIKQVTATTATINIVDDTTDLGLELHASLLQQYVVESHTSAMIQKIYIVWHNRNH